MIEDEIKRKIENFRELGVPSYTPRSSTTHIVPEMVSTLIGSRRSGKSYRALQCADELVKNRKVASKNHICYLDFDNPILSQMSAK